MTETDTTERILRRWLGGIPYEVAFWRSYYGSKRRFKELLAWTCYGQECKLECFDVRAYIDSLPADTAPLIVDLGCALSYKLGNVFPSRPDVRVEYVDPLAPFYNRILARYRIDRPAIRFGMVETASSIYPAGSVALIHVRNALDHCADPMTGIIECLASLRQGGVLYLNHFRNEALREAYRGFHQWNIDRDTDGRLIIWNDTDRIDVAERLTGVADVECHLTEAGRVVAVITLRAPLPPTLYTPAQSARRSAMMLSATVTYFHSLPRSMRYQWSRAYTTLGHRLMRLLPNRLMHRIKHLLSKQK